MQHQHPGTTEDLNQPGVPWTIGPEQKLGETVAEGVKQEGMFFEVHSLWLLPFFCIGNLGNMILQIIVSQDMNIY